MRSPRFIAVFAIWLTGCGFAFRVTGRNITAPPTIPVRPAAPERPANSRLSVIWGGHATVLLQMDDIWVLTDPVFTEAVGVVSPRLIAPGIEPSKLPKLAVVAVSHMHFDHLSFDSLEALESKTSLTIVPPGVKANMPRYDFEIRELATWQSFEQQGLRVTAVPVKHVGGRYGLDEPFEERAFTGYVFEYRGQSVYFGGDTAYAPQSFAATRRRFPRLDLAVLPICPIAPRDFMERTHLDPPQALTAFRDLGAARMLPIHFDTYINSDDSAGECGARLRAGMAARRLTDAEVPLLSVGEQRVLRPL
jgi:N-acyl-phosphatidylethanolamine-hydrolysing phospholipase D